MSVKQNALLDTITLGYPINLSIRPLSAPAKLGAFVEYD